MPDRPTRADSVVFLARNSCSVSPEALQTRTSIPSGSYSALSVHLWNLVFFAPSSSSWETTAPPRCSRVTPVEGAGVVPDAAALEEALALALAAPAASCSMGATWLFLSALGAAGLPLVSAVLAVDAMGNV